MKAKKGTKGVKVGALPKGFKPITGGKGSSWAYRDEPTLSGTLLKFGEVPSKYKKGETQRFAEIKRDGDGATITVWESAGTRPLFELKKGKRIAVAYLGEKKIKGRKQPMHDFAVGAA